MTIERFTDIRGWQATRTLVRSIYSISKNGRLAADVGVRDQLRRAGVSAMSNIAEGFGRGTDKDFARFLDMALGSLIEVQSLLFVLLDIGYCDQATFDDIYEQAAKAIGLVSALRSHLGPRVREDHPGYAVISDDARRRTHDAHSP